MMNKSILGVGNTATVYEWYENKAIKLFHEGYPIENVGKEYINARIVENTGMPVPRVYEVLKVKRRVGIVYERVEGETLTNRILRLGAIKDSSKIMASLHRQMLSQNATMLPCYKMFLKQNILESKIIGEKSRFLEAINELPEGNTLCHGDFHPGNILISNRGAIVIDFMNVCRGNALYDIARSVYLMEFTPISEETENREVVRRLKREMTDAYLEDMDVSRESLEEYLTIIRAGRTGECPSEW